MKKVLFIILVGAAFYQWSIGNEGATSFFKNSAQSISSGTSDNAIERAYKSRRSDVQVNDSGTVIKLLRDDNEGSRHQKFILRLSSGQTILIAHNIDLAPRINSIAKGDTVQFYGEYEWNDKGGVVHWTHHDPRGSHIGGWLKHNGSTYQ
ncbi:MAG: DUF3465 domain-containing protein [Cycloclasticus sp.]